MPQLDNIQNAEISQFIQNPSQPYIMKAEFKTKLTPRLSSATVILEKVTANIEPVREAFMQATTPSHLLSLSRRETMSPDFMIATGIISTNLH